MSLKHLTPGAVLIALTVACGTDKSTNPSPAGVNALTAAEFSSMVEALTAANAFGFGQSAVASPDVNGPVFLASEIASQATQTITVDQTQTCPNGGTAHLGGSGTRNATGAQTGTITMYAQLTLSGCRAVSGDGQQFTFDGNPTLNEAVTGTFAPGSISLSAHETGDLRWSSSSGKSGTCPFSLSVTTTTTGLTTTGHATGEICGITVDRTF